MYTISSTDTVTRTSRAGGYTFTHLKTKIASPKFKSKIGTQHANRNRNFNKVIFESQGTGKGTFFEFLPPSQVESPRELGSNATRIKEITLFFRSFSLRSSIANG